MSTYFEQAYAQVMDFEGRNRFSNNSRDPGQQTFSGISRYWWPDWPGWPLVDTWIRCGMGVVPPELETMVREHYRINFWNRLQGDRLSEISFKVACELFETSVNMDVSDAVRFLQEGYNVARGEYGEDLVVDGRLGPKTIETLSKYMQTMPGSPTENEEILLNCMNGEQYIFYKKNPRHKYFRGWFKRV